jgi:predicted metal-binding protein
LSAFFRTQGHFASEVELVAIIRCIDQDGDATAGYSEWADF